MSNLEKLLRTCQQYGWAVVSNPTETSITVYKVGDPTARQIHMKFTKRGGLMRARVGGVGGREVPGQGKLDVVVHHIEGGLR